MKRTVLDRFVNPEPACRRYYSVLLLLIIAMAACGTTLVNIRVDVRSFLSEEELSIEYGTDPEIPGNGPTVEIQTPVQMIPLPEEVNQITDIDAIEIRNQVEFRNDTGEATLFYRIFFDSAEDSIFDTPPVIEQRVELIPGTTTQSDILIDGDPRLLNLFEGDEIAVASEIEVFPGESDQNIAGVVELLELIVQIVAVGDSE